MFGINGFVIGPLIAALFIAFWQIFADEFNPTHQPVDSQSRRSMATNLPFPGPSSGDRVRPP
ncbi:hypothetical protein UMZ34_21865 [Halopseudomonas pachastrellae]|nr:hypothetical protein UMZ34_21865 [Halopseudomonas pachastrellae]